MARRVPGGVRRLGAAASRRRWWWGRHSGLLDHVPVAALLQVSFDFEVPYVKEYQKEGLM